MTIKNREDLYEASFTRNIGVISEVEQERLRNSHVTVVGAGGVGGITLIQLARMGVGAIHVIDKDIFEASNMNRQMLSSVSCLGKEKAAVARDVLLDINPSINIRVTEQFVTEENAFNLLKNTDVVIDATDNLVSRAIIHRTAYALGIPSVWIAVTPPFRGGVMSLTPKSLPYELALGYPSFQQELTEEMQAKIHAMKDGRALYSVQHGADQKWAESYVQKQRPWAVMAPVANIVGVIASFEAFKFLIKRKDLHPVTSPDLIKINMADQSMVTVVSPETGRWDYATL